jgi:hypothetical protein
LMVWYILYRVNYVLVKENTSLYLSNYISAICFGHLQVVFIFEIYNYKAQKPSLSSLANLPQYDVQSIEIVFIKI